MIRIHYYNTTYEHHIPFLLLFLLNPTLSTLHNKLQSGHYQDIKVILKENTAVCRHMTRKIVQKAWDIDSSTVYRNAKRCHFVKAMLVVHTHSSISCQYSKHALRYDLTYTILQG